MEFNHYTRNITEIELSQQDKREQNKEEETSHQETDYYIHFHEIEILSLL